MISMYTLLETVLELNQEAFKYLLEIYGKEKNVSGRLIFPTYAGGKRRVSEQELRFAYAKTIEQQKVFMPFYFSVETPTKETYQFSGKVNERSAISDLALYDMELNLDDNVPEFKKVCNIECKAHNPTIESIKKDIEKLVKEKETGVWGHLLLNQDSGTLRELFKKFSESFRDVLSNPDIKQHSIDKAYFWAIGTLEKRQLLTRKIEPGELLGDLSKIFSIDYNKIKPLLPGKYVDFENSGWQVDIIK